MKKNNWTLFLLIVDCITVFFIFTAGLIIWLFLIMWSYEPEMPYFNINEFIFETLVITAIYVTAAAAGINSIFAYTNLLKDKPLTCFNKISIWIMRFIIPLIWGGVLYTIVMAFF